MCSVSHKCDIHGEYVKDSDHSLLKIKKKKTLRVKHDPRTAGWSFLLVSFLTNFSSLRHNVSAFTITRVLFSSPFLWVLHLPSCSILRQPHSRSLSSGMQIIVSTTFQASSGKFSHPSIRESRFTFFHVSVTSFPHLSEEQPLGEHKVSPI
jgi:hypothetical protein